MSALPCRCQYVASHEGEFVLGDSVWIAKGKSALYVLGGQLGLTVADGFQHLDLAL